MRGAYIPLSVAVVLVDALLAAAPPQSAIRLTREIDHGDGPVQCVAFSLDGTTVAGCGDRLAQIFDARTGKRLQCLAGHTDKVRSIAFSPDGKLLASGSDDRTIRIWETATGNSLKSLHAGQRFPAAFPVRCVAFLPDGKTLASCGTNNFVTFWDVGSGLWERKAWTNHDAGGLVHLAISPDGKHCAVAGGVSRRLFASQVTLYDLDNGLKWRSNHEHDGEEGATHVSFSPDGIKMLSCGHDNTTRVWDVAKGSLLRKLHGPDGNQAMQAASFTPDGIRVIAVTREGTLRVWSTEDGSLLSSFKIGDRAVLSLAVAPGGATLATGGEDGAIQLWKLGEKLTGTKSKSDRE